MDECEGWRTTEKDQRRPETINYKKRLRLRLRLRKQFEKTQKYRQIKDRLEV